MRLWWLLPLVYLLGSIPTAAQGLFCPCQVFIENNDTLIFLDDRTGAAARLTINGERFTITAEGVMYYDPTTRQVMLAQPDGDVEPHPTVQMTAEARRIDWVVAEDGITVAWTLTGTDADGRLTTRTTVARLDGATPPRPILTEVDEAGTRLRALPIAFNPDQTILYMDNHPDGISQFTAFDQYVGIFALDLTNGEKRLLPDEQGSSCICGAAVRADIFLRLRLRLSAQATGFDMHIYNLLTEGEVVLDAVERRGFDTAGDVLISPDGTLAIYALARITDFNQPTQAVETVFILVDIASATQQALTPTPITTFVRPVAWTEDNSAVIFTSPEQDGTWKINISDGRLERIANATYIGALVADTGRTP
jgi:hypothetical protein